MLVDGKHIILQTRGLQEHFNAYKVIVQDANETYVDHAAQSLRLPSSRDLLKGCGDRANTDYCMLIEILTGLFSLI